MTIQQMHHVSVVVDDLEAAMAFFAEHGMELEGQSPIEGPWVDRVNGLDGARVHIAMMRTPDGSGRRADRVPQPSGGQARARERVGGHAGPAEHHVQRRRSDASVAGLRADGAELVGEVAQYEDSYRLCYVRGPAGIIVALAEPLG